MAWQARYLSALHTRDASEHALAPILSSYTGLADRLARQHASGLAVQPPSKGSPLPNTSPHLGQRQGSGSDAARLTAQANADLAEAQKARAGLEARAKELALELEGLKLGQRSDQRRLQELSSECQGLGKKVRDRDEELREKAKLLDDVHNETVALTIQLNVSEETNAKLRVENKELVDRWMARMGREADAMNDASNFN